MTRLYFTGVSLSASASTSRTVPDDDPSAPNPSAFRLALRDAKLTPGAPDTKHILGKMFLTSRSLLRGRSMQWRRAYPVLLAPPPETPPRFLAPNIGD